MYTRMIISLIWCFLCLFVKAISDHAHTLTDGRTEVDQRVLVTLKVIETLRDVRINIAAASKEIK